MGFQPELRYHGNHLYTEPRQALKKSNTNLCQPPTCPATINLLPNGSRSLHFSTLYRSSLHLSLLIPAFSLFQQLSHSLLYQCRRVHTDIKYFMRTSKGLIMNRLHSLQSINALYRFISTNQMFQDLHSVIHQDNNLQCYCNDWITIFNIFLWCFAVHGAFLFNTTQTYAQADMYVDEHVKPMHLFSWNDSLIFV